MCSRQGVGVWVCGCEAWGMVRVQGMCPHEFHLGTCTCIKLLKQYTAEMYPRMKNVLSFFGQKKLGRGGP